MRSIGLTPIVGIATLAAAAFACSNDISAESQEHFSRTSQAINGDRCDQVVLNASRLYSPTSWTDASFTFTNGTMTFAIPNEIPVTVGAASGTGPGAGANLTLSNPNAADVICQYVGAKGATTYTLNNCSNGAQAGDTMEAQTFLLHLQNGEHSYAMTTVNLIIDELRPCDSVTRGEVLFNDHTFASAPRTASYTLDGLGGNGRACSDCHMESEAFQLPPAAAEARYQQMIATGVDDPLFRPIDANDFRTHGDAASDYTNLRAGLVRITFPLPPNLRLIDPATNLPSSETSVDVWRAPPSIFNVAITGSDNVGRVGDNGGAIIGPDPNGGYQLDGRIATLPDQALGALINHAQATVTPPDGVLQDIAAYQSAQFTSPSVATLAAAILSNTTPFPDPDPVLTDLEQQGKAIFQRSCATCHGSAGHPSTTTPTIDQRFHRIASNCPRAPIPDATDGFGHVVFPPCPSVALANVRTYQFFDPATNTTRNQASDDLGRSYFTGRFVDRFTFEVPPLFGIRNTAPYFHNNAIPDLDTIFDWYFAFFLNLKRTSVAPHLPAPLSSDGINPDRMLQPTEKSALVAYLNKL